MEKEGLINLTLTGRIRINRGLRKQRVRAKRTGNEEEEEFSEKH